jgi:hypothetical protein
MATRSSEDDANFLWPSFVRMMPLCEVRIKCGVGRSISARMGISAMLRVLAITCENRRACHDKIYLFICLPYDVVDLS